MNRIILLLAYLFSSTYGIAQSKILINVIDSLSNNPIPYASITLGKSGGLTDDYGQANMKWDPVKISDTLFVSMIGYKSGKVLVSKQISNYTIKLVQLDVKLKEVSIIGFNNSELIDRLFIAYKKCMQGNRSFAAFLNSYTIKEDNNPVENIAGAYNFNFSGLKLNNIELKHGYVVFPNEEMNKNFLSIGITKLHVLLNPFGLNTSKQFESPWRMTKKKILETYHLSYIRIGDEFLKINFSAKNNGNNGYAIIHLDSLKLEELSMTWRFRENYPLVSINENAFITDTMTISSNTYFKNSKFTHQLLRFDFIYNKEKMKTRSVASYVDSNTFHMPLNFIEYNNDYLNILSRPDLGLFFKIYGDDMKRSSRIDSIFNMGIEDASLLSSNNLSNETKIELTEICFFRDDWALDWGKIGSKAMDKQLDTKINTFIFADMISYRDSNLFIVEPVFDYAGTTYNYERDAKAASYISNYFYLTKIQSDLLKKELQENRLIEYSQFKELVSKHDALLKKRLWRYKLETNGGNNEQAMSSWNTLIFNELKN